MMGKSKASSSARELFGKSRGVNLLAAVRIFLFGARDVWFVVGVPVFLYANGWPFTMVGGFMALCPFMSHALAQCGDRTAPRAATLPYFGSTPLRT
jgi:hypothetical protein